MSGTPYTNKTVTKSKVEVLKSLIEDGNHETKFVQAINKKVVKSEDLVELTNFYIVSTDDLNSRLEIFKAIRSVHKKNNKECFIIDMRSRAKISEVYVINLADDISSFWYEKSIETRLLDKTEPVHCNESNIIQNSYLASSIAIQSFSDILDGDLSTKYFRLSIDNFHISKVKVPLDEFQKEFRKMKLREACQICKKKHKTWKKLQSCKVKPVKKSKLKKDDGLLDRDAIFG